jgi:hypothetical protein
MHKGDLYTQSEISTRTSVICRLWFYTQSVVYSHECNFDTYKFDYDTNDYDYDTLECDL